MVMRRADCVTSVTCGCNITSPKVLATDQSYSGSAGIFSRRTNQIQEARVYSHNGPIGFYECS
eukprot:8289532-Pyramimonas_sp.AAC.1